MELSEELAAGIDVALNEADFCDLRINERTGEVRLLFLTLSLPEIGPEPRDRRVVISCTGVSRIVASLRTGLPDGSSEVVPLMLEELPSTVRSFGSQPVYGWAFLDVVDPDERVWRDFASIDFSVGRGRGEHSLDLFQDAPPGEDPERRLDVRIEFDDMSVMDARGRTVPLEEFVAGGRRWWAALRAGDERVKGHGIALPGSPGDADAGPPAEPLS